MAEGHLGCRVEILPGDHDDEMAVEGGDELGDEVGDRRVLQLGSQVDADHLGADQPRQRLHLHGPDVRATGRLAPPPRVCSTATVRGTLTP